MMGENCSTEDVMNFLVRRRASGCEPAWIADVLQRLVWLTDDNGGEIELVRRRWLVGDDRFRAEVALSMTDVFPADSREELVAVMERVKHRWPEFAEHCGCWLRQWDAQQSRSGRG